MPGGFPLGLELCNSSDIGTVLTTSSGTSVSAASGNTPGSWTQIVASAPSDVCFVTVIISNGLDAGYTSFFDIGVGSAGNEVPIINKLGHFFYGAQQYAFPVSIPAGTRVSARAQANTGGTGGLLQIHLFDGAFTQMEGCAGVDAIGFISATSLGTTINNSGINNTKGSFTQLIASTAKDYLGFSFYIDVGEAYPSTNTGTLIDIAVGSSGSEVVILPNWEMVNITQQLPPLPPFFPMPIPAGTRISARQQASANYAFNMVFYGVYQ